MIEVMGDPPSVDGRPMTPEEEVRFWRFFYAESVRLFGDKEGTFESLTAKAMRLLEPDAEFYAVNGKPIYEFYTPPTAPDNIKAEIKKHHDDGRRELWKKQHNPGLLAASFQILTTTDYYGLMSKDDAIRAIKKEFRFPSYDAAYKALQRAGVKGLPSTW